MAFVRRANVVLEVNDDHVQRFIDQGYDVIDEAGKIISKSTPKDVVTLQNELKRAQDKIKQLELMLANAKTESVEVEKVHKSKTTKSKSTSKSTKK